MSWPFALSEVITFLLFAIIFTSVHELDRGFACLLFWLWLGVINANRSYWNINTSIHTSPVWLAPAGAAIKCPLVKCPSWPELGPKLPPWLRAGRERSNPGWRIDTDETAETNTTRHYNNNVTTLRDLNSVSALSRFKNGFSVTRWGSREPWWQDYYLYYDDICLTSDNCDVSRDTGDTRDMWPDISWHGPDIHGLWLSQKIPHITVSI